MLLDQYRYGEPMVRVGGLADTHYETMKATDNLSLIMRANVLGSPEANCT